MSASPPVLAMGANSALTIRMRNAFTVAWPRIRPAGRHSTASGAGGDSEKVVLAEETGEMGPEADFKTRVVVEDDAAGAE